MVSGFVFFFLPEYSIRKVTNIAYVFVVLFNTRHCSSSFTYANKFILMTTLGYKDTDGERRLRLSTCPKLASGRAEI